MTATSTPRFGDERSDHFGGARPAERLAYLPALDGLRAVAVTLVVAYHLDVGWARGGFLGVDLFFVISGFLITTLLIQEHDSTGRIGLGSFWTRRFRRLVPPLVVMTAATVAATRLYGLPEQWTSIRWDAAAAIGYVANWRFLLADQSYFETLLGPSPLRHTWSLAVEEQWYILWPMVVLLLVLIARRAAWGRWVPVAVIAGGAAASATLMAVLHDPADPTRVYFGTDTRAQQLLVGAGLAWLLARHRNPVATPSSRTVAHTVAHTALIVVSFVAFVSIAATASDQSVWLYNGGFLVVSLLCAVIIWAVADRDGPLRWLGAPALVWVGIRSYGIYLWHWPVIVFVGPPMGIDLPRPALATLQVALSVALAELSFRLIERPVRGSTLRPSLLVGSWTTISLVTALVAALILVPPAGRTLVASDVVRPSTTTTMPAPLRAPAAVAHPTIRDTHGSTRAPVAAEPVAPTTVLVLGDSTALALAENRTLDVGPRWNLQAFARLGCSISDGDPLDAGADLGIIQGEECDRWRAEWTDAVAEVEPDISVVMVGAWEVLDRLIDGVGVRFPDQAWFDIVGTAVRDAIAIAGAGGTDVALLAVPCMRQAPDTVLQTLARNDLDRVAAVNTIFREQAAADPDVHFVDLADRLCPDGTYLEDVDGAKLRYDGVHLTPEGADYVWSWLVDELSSLRASSPGPDGRVSGTERLGE